MVDKIPNSLETPEGFLIPPELEQHVRSGQFWEKYITGIELFERDKSEIAEYRNGFVENNFPNTEFAIRKNNTDCIVIFVGESWCYGGRHRDMVIGPESTESAESFAHAVNTTVGSRVAFLLNSDLHQSAWPGDQTTNMFIKMEQLVEKYVNDNRYKKIRVVTQITDSHRDETLHHIYEGYPIYDMITRGNIGQTVEQWLAEYDLSFVQWADRISNKYAHKDIEFVVWKNFNPWVGDLEKLKSHDRVHIVEKDWTTFSAMLEGVQLPTHKILNNTAQLDPDRSLWIGDVVNLSKEVRDQQMDCIQQSLDYYNESVYRLELLHGYPSTENHRLWAAQICNAAGWKNDF